MSDPTPTNAHQSVTCPNCGARRVPTVYGNVKYACGSGYGIHDPYVMHRSLECATAQNQQERDALRAEIERLLERIAELENRNGKLNRSQVDMKNDLFRLRAETHAIRNQNTDDSLTLATLYDMVLGEDWGDNSNEQLIRAVKLLQRNATTKESLSVHPENP